MNQYNFTYTIKEISEDKSAMVVTYQCEGFDDIDIGTRTPYTDETLEAIVEMYAPVQYWNELSATYSDIEIGSTGQMSANLPSLGKSKYDGLTPEELFNEKQFEAYDTIANVRYGMEESGQIIVEGKPISTDRATQAKLSALNIMQLKGNFSSINFKGADGSFFIMDETMLNTITLLVISEIQSHFEWEKIAKEAISSATSVEEIESLLVSYGSL